MVPDPSREADAMRKTRFLLPAAALAMLAAAACATTPRMSDAQKLALYQGQAGAPVKSVRYVQPIGWQRIDDLHFVLDVRPRESWLVTMSGPCLGWGRGEQVISLSHHAGFVSAGLDSVDFPSSQISCRIKEIRLVDPAAVRAARDALATTP
jgi:hypothetical protein